MSITSPQIQSTTESGDRFKINDRELSQVQWNPSNVESLGPLVAPSLCSGHCIQPLAF